MLVDNCQLLLLLSFYEKKIQLFYILKSTNFYSATIFNLYTGTK